MPHAYTDGRLKPRTLLSSGLGLMVLLVGAVTLSGCGYESPKKAAKAKEQAQPKPLIIDANALRARPVYGQQTGTLVADTSTTPPAADGIYEYRQPTKDGTGKFYMGREIAHVMGHQAAGWLERPDREKEEQPGKVIEWMDLKKDDVVADIGAGTGYFSFRIAEKIPDGKVLAVDIQQEMLDLLRKQSEAKGVKNVEPIMGKIDDPNLPAGSVDVALMVDAYHEFDHPREMMLGIVKGLKVGGRLVQVEYRGEDPKIEIKPLHKMTQEQAKKEMAAVGLEYVKTFDGLPSQHVMIFRKTDKPAPGASPAAPQQADDNRQLLSVAPRFSVAKVDEAVKYYKEKLGFKVDREEHGFAVVSRDGVSIQLIVPEGNAADAPRGATQFAADCDAYVWSSDVKTLHDELRKRGALIASSPTKRRDAIEFDVSTPDGSVIRFAQRLGGETANTNP